MKTKIFYFLLSTIISFTLSSCYDCDDDAAAAGEAIQLSQKNFQIYSPGGTIMVKSLNYNKLKLTDVVVKENGVDPKDYVKITTDDKHYSYVSSEDWGEAHILNSAKGDLVIKVNEYAGKSRIIMLCVSAGDAVEEWIQINQTGTAE